MASRNYEIKSRYNDILFWMTTEGIGGEYGWVAAMAYEKLQQLTSLTVEEIERVAARLLPRWEA